MLVQTLITDYFPIVINKKLNKKRKFLQDNELYKSIYSDNLNKKIKVYGGYNPETDSWHCLECGDDMGPNNPRQLCGKYFCYNYDL